MKRKWDMHDEQVRRKCVDEVIARVEEQEGGIFGTIAANDVIDIVLQNLAPNIYNTALQDTTKLIRDKLNDLQIDIDLLKQQT